MDKLFLLTNVPRHYLENLLREEYHRLPAAPYVASYLQKIATVLDLNNKELWKIYKEESDPLSSGENDRLPENRFAFKKINKKWIWTTLAVVIVGFYLALNANRLVGRPSLTIYNPATAMILVNNALFTVSGSISPQDKIFVNNEEINADSSGKFEETYTLQPGLNVVEFVAKRFLGQETTVARQIIYQTNDK